jgi:hypothetical protein
MTFAKDLDRSKSGGTWEKVTNGENMRHDSIETNLHVKSKCLDISKRYPCATHGHKNPREILRVNHGMCGGSGSLKELWDLASSDQREKDAPSLEREEYPSGIRIA